VLRRPLSESSVAPSLRVAYGLVLREQRRYFRCPVEIPATLRHPGMEEVCGRVVNITEGGVAITARLSLQPGCPRRTNPQAATAQMLRVVLTVAPGGTPMARQKPTTACVWVQTPTSDVLDAMEKFEQSLGSANSGSPAVPQLTN
jgi:hypothetical protein